MPVKLKGKKIAQKEALDNLCFEHSLTIKKDERRKDYVISKDNVYLFRAVLHPQKDYFGIRFKVSQFANYDYTKEKILKLIDKILEERSDRKVTVPEDYSKEKHITDE